MNGTKLFSPDYATARQRFCDAATRLGWRLEHHPLDIAGPAGEELSVDVASSFEQPSGQQFSGQTLDGQTLVLSSGVHGVEGFFGSAVQLDLLERWARESPPPLRCVFLHGLNPYGFAWLRRFDEQNVDPNRNFLLDDEGRIIGASRGTRRLSVLGSSLRNSFVPRRLGGAAPSWNRLANWCSAPWRG